MIGTKFLFMSLNISRWIKRCKIRPVMKVNLKSVGQQIVPIESQQTKIAKNNRRMDKEKQMEVTTSETTIMIFRRSRPSQAIKGAKWVKNPETQVVSQNKAHYTNPVANQAVIIKVAARMKAKIKEAQTFIQINTLFRTETTVMLNSLIHKSRFKKMSGNFSCKKFHQTEIPTIKNQSKAKNNHQKNDKAIKMLE
jgi:hypothetical protein